MTPPPPPSSKSNPLLGEGTKWPTPEIVSNPGHLGVIGPDRSELLLEQEWLDGVPGFNCPAVSPGGAFGRQAASLDMACCK